MKVAVIGLGLIGGSLVKSLRTLDIATNIIGVDASPEHQEIALSLGLVDQCLPLEEAVNASDFVIVATPVNTIPSIIRDVLDLVEEQTVIDVGSTKAEIIRKVKGHPKRSNFVACHPMAGTEYSGPEAAVSGLFTNKYVVICDHGDSDLEKFEMVRSMFEKMEMKVLLQEAEAHDTHVAYVSHISHISSFALAITVLKKEVDEDRIFELASTGFSSTVRLAKSSPATWVPIFEQNRDNVLEVLDEHISVLSDFRSSLIKKNYEKFHDLICEANKIKKILK
ncbi:prephenate dehydrogenase [Portibacter lacus]|uniref:Prephenate dehydrogenase n=1 Tax=Portibacter lacus TaxID=1099794 RepID=A0AA37SUT9_9BACT|nr:prephenate dehydrogenase [Portibacter lacus]GLR19266.1 prephenate dehydrogenase [Portibacter lacus]